MRTFRYYLFFLTIFLAILWAFLPGYYRVYYPKSPGPDLDPQVRMLYRDQIVASQPEVVLLGDSMLVEGIDQDRLSTLLGTRVYQINFPGSASAVWYLIIKNNILNSPHKPGYLIVFFRDTMLTTPDYRVTGKYLAFIDEFASPSDHLLIQLAYVNQMSPLERLAQCCFPLYGERLKIRAAVDDLVKYTIPDQWFGYDRAAIDRATDEIFGSANLEQGNLNWAITTAEAYLYTDRNLSFETQVTHSFLPAIIRLCRKNGIQLIFVSMKTLHFAPPKTEPAGLENYMQSLKIYLEESDIPLLDFSHDERLKPEHFTDLLHMNAEGREIFTRILAEALQPIIHYQSTP